MENKFTVEIGGRELTAEIKGFAEQANGEVFVRYGDTMVLATCVMSNKAVEQDFFPLTVDYEERYYAAGKIRGPRYIKRETRPSDEAIGNARLIDRTIRPLFSSQFNREVQVVVTVLSWDGQNDPDVLGILASSLALSISDIPWSGPVAAVRVGKNNGTFIVNPTYEEREKDKSNIVFSACRKDKSLLINMIEGSFDETDENSIVKSWDISEPEIKKLIDFQSEIVKKIGKEKAAVDTPEKDAELEKDIGTFLGDRLDTSLYISDKRERFEAVEELKNGVLHMTEEKYAALPSGREKIKYALSFFDKEIERIIHQNTIFKNKRPDGRKPDEIREISCEVGLLPRTHGSSIFRRGQTKSLSILTLGAPGDHQILEGMEIVGKKHFMHHYNFPAYSVGEVKPMRGPGRREIGHGMLAERALLPMIPSFEEFPYTIRIVSEILSSNGSSSMAATTSASLSLMDAGVPIKRPVTGISIGLMQNEKGDYKILADIQGPEDHYGDMDFKVAGTRAGITAIQMDVKVEGINKKMLEESLDLGKKIRNQILDKIEKVISAPRAQLSPFAPRVLKLKIDPEKIREVIGPGGKMINAIIDECGVAIDIEDTGDVFVTAEKEEAGLKAIEWIKNITREIKVGEIFQGKVIKILNFGAVMEILPGQEGLLHISEMAPYRVGKVEDIVKIGMITPVKVIAVSDDGRISLSIKSLKQNYGNK